ncbi:hypothetical protein [Microbispora rosea]|nr:hypothetical protein [Microbispora rosea]
MTTPRVTDEEPAAWVEQRGRPGTPPAPSTCAAARWAWLIWCGSTSRARSPSRSAWPSAPRGDLRPNLVRIGEPAEVVWDWDDPDIKWRLTLPETQEIEGLLFDALAFDVTHEVLAEAGWVQTEDDCEEYTITLPEVVVPAARVPVVRLLHHDDDACTTGEVTVHPSEKARVRAPGAEGPPDVAPGCPTSPACRRCRPPTTSPHSPTCPSSTGRRSGRPAH